MAEIIITEFMERRAVQRLAERWSVAYLPQAFESVAEAAAEFVDARALIVRNRTQVSRELLLISPKLEVIGRLGVGLDNIDLAACEERNIEVHPATGANDISVAEYVLAMGLLLRRSAPLHSSRTLLGDWPRMDLIGHEAGRSTLGVVGVGRTAREAGRLAAAVGMHVAGYDPHLSPDDPVWSSIKRCDSLHDLLRRADVVSLHVPLTRTTRGLMGRAEIAAMRPGATLINAARGGVVDEIALVEALKSDRLGGAALDVFENEPLDADHAAMFADVPNLILTPHIAGLTEEANVRVSDMIASIIERHLSRP